MFSGSTSVAKLAVGTAVEKPVAVVALTVILLCKRCLCRMQLFKEIMVFLRLEARQTAYAVVVRCVLNAVASACTHYRHYIFMLRH
jgi:hypothetical protein